MIRAREISSRGDGLSDTFETFGVCGATFAAFLVGNSPCMRWGERLAVARAHNLSLGTVLERFTTIRGNQLLVDEVGGSTLTYAQAAERVARASGAVRARVAAGERVLVTTQNGYDTLLACLAASRAGAIPVPVNARMTKREIDHVERDAHATMRIDDLDLLVEEGQPADATPARPDDVAVLLYTSGTTGYPKGAALTHRAVVAHLGAGALVPAVMFGNGCVTGLPVAHVAGFTLLLQLMSMGACAHVLPHFRPTDALDLIERRRPTMFVGVPAMYRMMLEVGIEGRDLSSVRLWSSGADRLDDRIVERFQRAGALARLPGIRKHLGRAAFVDGYGMVEAAGGVAVRVFPPFPSPLTGALIPLRGHRFRVVDERDADLPRGAVGELLVAGPGVMRGYHGMPSDGTITDDGWLHTGDLARRRALGLFELVGRSKDVIKHGGYSVYAAEVERVLQLHDAVAEAAVVGIPDARKGEVPVAAVRLRDGATADPQVLESFASAQLADYKRPQRVLIVDALPRTGTDKIDKQRCRAMFDAEVHVQ